MIEVIIRQKETGLELGRIEMEAMHHHKEDPEVSDYSVRFAVDRSRGSIGIHQRGVFSFERKKYNVLGLLFLALQSLEPEEFRTEADNVLE